MKSFLVVTEHPVERVVRVLIGPGLLSLVFVGPKTPWGWIGIIPLLTGITGLCPLYSLLGISTCPKKLVVSWCGDGPRCTSEWEPTVPGGVQRVAVAVGADRLRDKPGVVTRNADHRGGLRRGGAETLRTARKGRPPCRTRLPEDGFPRSRAT